MTPANQVPNYLLIAKDFRDTTVKGSAWYLIGSWFKENSYEGYLGENYRNLNVSWLLNDIEETMTNFVKV